MKKKKLKGNPQNNIQSSSPAGKTIYKPGNSIFIFLLGLVVAFVVIVRLQFTHIPFERDEGIYCYMGQLVLDGKVPYLGFYEMKPPVLFYSYAAVIFLFGKTVEAVHTGFMILNILTIIFLYFIGKKLLHSRTAGILTAASYAILSLAPFACGFTVQSEHIISFFLTGGLLLLLLGIEKNRLFYFFFSGLIFCLAFLVKQNGIFFLAVGGIAIVIYSLLQKPVDWKQLIKRATVFGAGAALIIALITGILYLQGALKECLFWTYEYSKSYVSTVTLNDGFTFFKQFAGHIIDKNTGLWILAGAGFILPMVFSKGLSLFTRIFIWLFALLSFTAIIPGLAFYGHYWIFFMPSIALLVATGVLSIKNILLKYLGGNTSTMIALSSFVLAVGYNIYQQRDYYFNHDDKRVLRMVYGMNPFPEAKVIGDYIKQNTTEKDAIGIFGSETEIYFYADRRCPTKHCYCYPMLSAYPKAPVFQKEFERDMEAALPKYFVVFKNPASFSVAAADSSVLTWLNSFLLTKYNVVGAVDMISEENTQYVWGTEALRKYTVKSELSGYVFERQKRQAVN